MKTALQLFKDTLTMQGSLEYAPGIPELLRQ